MTPPGPARFRGKVALITGAATGVEGRLQGLGASAAMRFAREGAAVVLTDVDDAAGVKTAARMRASGAAATYVHLDVADEAQWRRAIARAVDAHGRIDVLVHAAGVTHRTTVEETTEAQWDAQIDVHLKGAFLGVKHVIPAMRRGGGGSVVLVGSLAGIVGSASSTGYHAAKGGMRVFAKAAAVQYAKENIRVNSVHPGFTLTPMFEPLTRDRTQVEARLSKVPMRRLGRPEEIASAILFLASDEASYVTGADLIVDGGYTAQ